MTGELIDGKYRLERVLGEGGMGVVYLARHEGIGRPVALKLIRPWAPGPMAARFAVEARALGAVKHPSIVDVTDSGIDPAGGRPYLVMEYLEGRTLDDLIREGGLDVDHALALLEKVADAVDHAHEAGVLHRDLKPRNVYVGRAKGRRGRSRCSTSAWRGWWRPGKSTPPLRRAPCRRPTSTATRRSAATRCA